MRRNSYLTTKDIVEVKERKKEIPEANEEPPKASSSRRKGRVTTGMATQRRTVCPAVTADTRAAELGPGCVPGYPNSNGV